MSRHEVDVRYEWKHHRNGRRHWYERKWFVAWNIGPDLRQSNKESSILLATVTLCADHSSPHFNRWFAEVYAKKHSAGHTKSEPLMSLADAKAWVEVIERMSR